MFRRIRTGWLPWGLLVLATGAWAQQVPPSAQGIFLPTTLKQAFDAAWQRQPEAQSRAARQQAAIARRQAAESWTVEPAALELSVKGDRLNRNQGSREIETGIAIPLWLPGERARTRALADAEVRATASRVLAAQLRTAASVRSLFGCGSVPASSLIWPENA